MLDFLLHPGSVILGDPSGWLKLPAHLDLGFAMLPGW